MVENTRTGDLYDDSRDERLEELVQMIRDETDALAELLPSALVRQWRASPVPVPREDTTERSKGDRASDPTGDAALDGRRMAVRATVRDAEALLRQTAARARGVRLGMERAVAAWDGSRA